MIKDHDPALSAAIFATLSARPRADLEREVRSKLFRGASARPLSDHESER